MRKYVKALTNLAVALVIFLIVVFLVPRLLIFFAPFVVGWIIALIAGPPVHFFESKLKIKRRAGSVVVIVLVIGLVSFAIYLTGAKLIKEAIDLINDLPHMWESAKADFDSISQNFNVIYSRLPQDVQQVLYGLSGKVGECLGSIVSNASAPTLAAVSNFAKQIPGILIGIIMAMLSAYLFVAEREQMNEWFHKTLPDSLMKQVQLIKNSLVKAVGGYIKAQFKIEVWIYLLLVIGLSILQVDHILLLALLIAFLDIIPFFGTGTVLVPWALMKVMSANYQMAIGLMIIWCVSQLARQIIQPKIVGESVGVPLIPTLFLLYIGYRLGGVVGMIVAVPLGLIVYTMYQEGAFDTTKNSILILVNGINRFRKLGPEDMKDLCNEDETESAAPVSKEETHA